MKLIRCHIINFGGLSDFTIDFNDGLTVIQKENGFGKTTLAEFIRAMFYGFPRRGSQTLAKNARKKYLPWQGGRYGGYLIFEHEGKTYRIDRTFGKTKAGDTFRLSEGNNQRPSRDFSENIGEELFQLDADSFERSTYLPQVHSFDSLTTDSIQAKLGNLVDDTNDINNFEKAVEALRRKRSGYKAFRGEGGTIVAMQQKISELQEELSATAAVPETLLEERREQQRLQEERSVHQGALDRIRVQITEASEAEATLTVQKHHADLRQRRDNAMKERDDLRRELPEQVPTQQEIDRLLPVWDELASLKKTESDAREQDEAQRTVEVHGKRFAQGVPAEAEIEEYELKNTEYISTFSAAKGMKLSEREEAKLKELETFFDRGLPEETVLTETKSAAAKFRRLENQAAAERLPEEDRRQLEELDAFFAAGIPTSEELRHHRQIHAEITELQQENVRITSAQREQKSEEVPAEKKKKTFPLALLLAIVAGIAAVVLLVQKLYLPGGIVGGLGAVMFLVGILSYIKQTVRSEISSGRTVPVLGEYEKEQLRRNQLEIQRLEKELADFCGRYVHDQRQISEQLADICAKFSLYAPLRERRTRMTENLRRLSEEMQEVKAFIDKQLRPYFNETDNYDQSIALLQAKCEEYTSLCQKREELSQELQKNARSARELAQQISAFVQKFYGEIATEEFGKYLRALRRDSEAYGRAQQQLAAQKKEEEERAAAYSRCVSAITEFNDKYALYLSTEDRTQVQKLRDKVIHYGRLMENLREAENALREHYEEHAQQIDAPVSESSMDVEALKIAETTQKNQVDHLTEELLQIDQRIRNLEWQAEDIPKKQDEMEWLMEQRQADMAACDLLDTTMELMQQAKEDLNTGYLGDIKKSFANYMSQMADVEQKDIALDTNLGVRIEREGTARELEYFSVGQTDIVMLCMRLALVDALFKETKPFIVLDDPFVNLDDEHTKEALALLKRLGKEHQIVYMVCNSSRSV